MNFIYKLMMMQTCFQIYFSPIYVYVKRSFSLAFSNDGALIFSSLSLSVFSELINEFFEINYFGVSNGLLVWVIATILIDAFFGIKKSIKESRQMLEQAKIATDAAEIRMLNRKAGLKKFNPLKLQFTFFKVLTLIAYLFFAKHILVSDENGGLLTMAIGIASGVIIKAPLAIFWYYDFKSIGDNLEYLLKKKPPIFKIIEKIFEPKISTFFKNQKDE